MALSLRRRHLAIYQMQLIVQPYNRLSFEIASAPALFQRALDQVLLGLLNTHCYLDDILVTRPDDPSHLKTLNAVLSRLLLVKAEL